MNDIDHLVIGARTLDEGVAWCEATLGVTPGAGGKHALMGTHNRVFSIASARHPKTYFEIIAIDPEAPPPGRARWFDLDSEAMQRALEAGPGLIHWVMRCNDIEARCARLRDSGIERGDILAASRDTPRGRLEWRISVRPDGARLALPTLIQWAGPHPCDDMPASGVELLELQGGARESLAAHLLTPRGTLTLRGIA